MSNFSDKTKVQSMLDVDIERAKVESIKHLLEIEVVFMTTEEGAQAAIQDQVHKKAVNIPISEVPLEERIYSNVTYFGKVQLNDLRAYLAQAETRLANIALMIHEDGTQ